MTGPRPDILRPDGLELAVGTMVGPSADALELPSIGPGGTRGAIEQSILGALQRGPCAVSFSGGRDSSAILALATHVARREGLPLPLPITLTFPSVVESTERDWQERVIGHLGLTEWTTIECGEDLHAVGPLALEVLRRHGVLFPANGFLHVPMMREVRTGSILCGIGGDEVLDSPAIALFRWMRRFERPSRSGLRRTLDAVLPQRRKAGARRDLGALGWITDEARELAVERMVAAEEALGLRWNHALRHWVDDRYFRAMNDTFTTLGADHDVLVRLPFLDPAVLVALAADGGWGGFKNRAAVLTDLMSDLLPPDILGRTSKAVFTRALFSPAELVSRWQGEGIDPRFVDADRLRHELQKPKHDARTMLLLQQIALAIG